MKTNTPYTNASPSSDAITAEGLTKWYGEEKHMAVKDVSFAVKKGEIFGLIGPDGAGKTSIFRMLTTLLLPDGGQAQVNGFDIVKDYKMIRSTVGYMPGKFSLYQDLSVEENLHFFATVFNSGIEENYHLIKDIYVQLEPFKKRRAGQLSGGMKQKLALCCALIHKPDVLFLDEPTTGVDPVSRKEFWQMLQRLKDQGISILVATPYMDEATQCSRIGLMQSGKVIHIDTPQNLMASYPHKLLKIGGPKMSSLLMALQEFPEIISSYGFGSYAHAAVSSDNTDSVDRLKAHLSSSGLVNVSISSTSATIEDLFIHLTHANRNEN